MSVSVTNNYNTYIKLPNIGQDVLHVYIILKQNNTIIKQNNTIIKQNNTIIKQYDTSKLSLVDRYQLLIFNGSAWKKITPNGIDTNVYKILSVNYNFVQNRNYSIEYRFFKKIDQNTKEWISDNNLLSINLNSIQQNNYILKQRVNVVQQLIPHYNKTHNDIVLYWKHSWDYDKQLIYYQIQIYQHKKVFQNGDSYSQRQPYSFYKRYDNILKNEEQFQTKNFEESLFKQHTIYRYRVRAYDQFGQYSNWSQYYYFKKVKELYGKVLITRRSFDSFFNSIYILPPTKDINFSVSVLQRPMSQICSSVYIKQQKNCEISFNVIVQRRKTLYSQFFSNVYITANKYLLNMDVIIAKKYYNQLFGSVFVTANKNTLFSNIQVVPTIIQKIQLIGRYVLKDDLVQNIQLYKTFDPLIQNFDVQKRFSTTNGILNFILKIGKIEYNPIQLELYDSNNNLIHTDNRINIYDKNGQRIYTYNSNGVFIHVYPYVQHLSNTPISVFDIDGNEITQYYDQNGVKIDCLYDNNNIVKNWLAPNVYKIQYTFYDNYTTYYYNYSKIYDINPTYPTSYNFVNVNLNQSGQYSFVIRAVKNAQNIHNYDTREVIYINKPPQSVTPPFYINDRYMNNLNVINNANPTFQFNGVVNNDNDLIKYVIQIAKDDLFQNIVIQNYVQNYSDVIIHTLQDDTLLIDVGWYYFRVLTIDYNLNEQKQIAYSTYFKFKFQHYVLDLYGRLQRVTRYWQLLGFLITLRGNNDFNNKVTLYKKFQSDQLVNKVTLYKQRIQDQDNQLTQGINIRYNMQLINKVLVTRNYSILNSNIVIQYDYYKFPKTQTYTDENGVQHTVIIMPIPKSHFIYGQCTVYKDRLEDDINFGNIEVIKRYFSEEQNQPQYKVTIMARLPVAGDDTLLLRMKCRVWNIYNLPYQTEELKQIVSVSNRVYMLAWLYGKLQLRYPQPPDVIITSNIPEKIWQTNYNANFTFSLASQSVLPLRYYVYVLDDKPNTIPTYSNGNSSVSQLFCDLRQVGSKITGIKYLHVRSVNSKNVYSKNTTHYCIYYNNKIDRPTPLTVNGQSVLGDQMPTIQYTKPLTFYWSVVIDSIDIVDTITYDLQISADINFNNIQIQQKNIYGNFFNILAKTLRPNKYYWRVRAFDQNEYSNWSLSATFYINKAPQAPTRLTVKNYS